jgi:hypothetical protein
MTGGMNTRALGALLSLAVVIFVANVAIFFAALKFLPAGSADRAFVLVSVWFGAFIAYLVTLYRGGLLETWPRILRTLTFCGIAFAGTQLCGMSAAHVVHALLYAYA